MILQILFFICVSSAQGLVDPDAFRNVSELISSKGYPVEEYQVQSPDGYILGIQRIPHGIGNNHVIGSGKPIVFLHHGFTSLSDDWVINLANQSLGFILADSGYDVWLGNARGNKYSRKHVTLSPDCDEFWKFSLDELALHDLPATLDFILKVTGQSKLFYIGHSMGTSMSLALLSERPEYNDIIQTAILLGPAATLTYSGNVFQLFDIVTDVEWFLANVFGHGELKGSSLWSDVITQIFCNRDVKLCDNIFLAFSGMSVKQVNQTRIPVYEANHPAGAAIRCAVHFSQIKKARKFQKFDYGEAENLIKYNQPFPPEYVIENITTPIALMWGLNDHCTDPVDVNLLALRIQNLLVNYQVPDPEWCHVDFVLGVDAKKYVYDEILSILKKQIMKELVGNQK